MQPRVAIPSFTARDPIMLKWSGLLTWLGDGRQPHFSEDLFSRLDQDMLMMDDYGYAGIDIRNDPDLVLPEGEDWDATLGKKYVISFSYSDYFLMYYVILSFFLCMV